MTITKEILLGDILRAEPKIADILMSMGMHCLGCPSAQMETLADACAVHGLDVDDILKKLN